MFAGNSKLHKQENILLFWRWDCNYTSLVITHIAWIKQTKLNKFF